MSSAGWIGVDLDGTLAVYDGWKGINRIGKPVPAMLKRVKSWLARGIEVKIFTARAFNFDGSPIPESVALIEQWCVKHVEQKLEVTNRKDFGMIELWDDRAVQVIPNTGLRSDGKGD